MQDEAVERRVPEERRAALLAAIEAARGGLEPGRAAEEQRTLPEGCVQILRDLGAFWWKTPVELGGSPLDPLTFSDLIEALAYLDASVGWTAMIGAGTTGGVAGRLPDEGAEEVFRSGRSLPVVAGQPQPSKGVGREVDGGYVVTGRWSFASGSRHADWLLGAFQVEGGAGPALAFVVPKAEAEVIDTWHVAGLQGTGSCDFAVTDVFIPRTRTYERLRREPRRGGPLFRQEGLAFVGNELPPLCVGVTRRAIDDAVGVMAATTRGFGGSTLADREAFQRELGLADQRLRAAGLFYRDAIAASWDAALAGEPPAPAVTRAVGTAQVFVADECAAVVTALFRYGGGRVLSLDHPMQRHLRNVLAARQHGAATEEHYELAGRGLLGRGDPPGAEALIAGVR